MTPNFVAHKPQTTGELATDALTGPAPLVLKKRHRRRKQKSRKARDIAKLTPRMKDLAEGRLSIEDLDFEELTRGQLRDVNGKFSGRKPAVIPRAMHDLMAVEIQKRMQDMFNGKLQLSFDTMVSIATWGPYKERLAAAQYLMERAIGPIVQRSEVKSEVTVFEQNIQSGGFLVDLGEPDAIEEGVAS